MAGVCKIQPNSVHLILLSEDVYIYIYTLKFRWNNQSSKTLGHQGPLILGRSWSSVMVEGYDRLWYLISKSASSVLEFGSPRVVESGTHSDGLAERLYSSAALPLGLRNTPLAHDTSDCWFSISSFTTCRLMRLAPSCNHPSPFTRRSKKRMPSRMVQASHPCFQTQL